MNAIEFVQKHGVTVARDLATRDKTSIGYLSVEHHGLNQAELQELVNAYELVEGFGGLEGAKDHLNHRREYGLYSLPALKQAINLVEQCNAKP